MSEQVAEIARRVEELESRREQSPDPTDTPSVDDANAEGVFTDAIRVVGSDRNVLIYFATRNHAAGQPSTSTAQLGVYMHYYGAKRMQHALELTVRRHVAAFGELHSGDAAEQPTTHDHEQTRTIYTNFVRITGTPEEIIIQFGLNSQPFGQPTEPIPISHVVMMDFHTASELLLNLNTLISQYEARHGEIETNVERRLVN